ncbi:hypothetical protein GGS20DRAFT_531422 [Poronia punctata]|nr:hypothetical protein GGS20DRAFT_531422 [Poronia punctata]
MRGLFLALGVVAVVDMAGASMCAEDNCYRAFLNQQYAELGSSFCQGFLASTTTDAAVIPTPFENCEGSIAAVSSACACVASPATAVKMDNAPKVTPSPELPLVTAAAAAAAVVTTTEANDPSATAAATESKPEEPIVSASSSAASTGNDAVDAEAVSGTTTLTSTTTCSTTLSSTVSANTTTTSTAFSEEEAAVTSTVFSTKVYTVTSCAASVTDCPARSTPYETTELLTLTLAPIPSSSSSSSSSFAPVLTQGVYTYPVPSAGNNYTLFTTSKPAATPVGPSATVASVSSMPTAAADRSVTISAFVLAGGFALALL